MGPVSAFRSAFQTVEVHPQSSLEDGLDEGGIYLQHCFDIWGWAAGTAPCDMKLSGVDSQLANLTGGMDGLYKLWSCEGGRPLYKREEPGAWLSLRVCVSLLGYIPCPCLLASAYPSVGSLSRPNKVCQLRPVICLAPSSATTFPQPFADHHCTCSYSCLHKHGHAVTSQMTIREA